MQIYGQNILSLDFINNLAMVNGEDYAVDRNVDSNRQNIFSQYGGPLTFSRGSQGTITDSTGKITYAPNNLFTYSEQFDNAAWAKQASTVSANVTQSPDGSNTADKISEDSATNAHSIFQTFTPVPGTIYIFSFYAKSAERTWVHTRGELGLTYFNLSNGTVGTVASGVTANITSVGNGWYRCSVSKVITVSIATNVQISPTTGDAVDSYAGTTGFGVYAWGAQLEAVTYQTTPRAYIPTTTAAYYGPRFDYDPLALTSKGLLIEEARQNLLTYSQDFTNAVWTTTNVTSTGNAIVAPDGTTTATKLAATTTAATNTSRGAGAATSASMTYSIYAKQGTGATVGNTFGIRNATTSTNLLFVSINYSTGAITYGTGTTGASVQALPNGWWRITLTVTSGITVGDTLSVYTGFTGNSQTAGDFLYAWGAQLEAGSFATSYIPTVASTVTRNTDSCTMTGANFANWFNQQQGTWVSAADSNQPVGATRAIVIGYTGTRYYNYIHSSAGAIAIYDGVNINLSSGKVIQGVPFKSATTYGPSGISSQFSGDTATTNTLYNGSFTNETGIQFGSGTGNLNGHLRSIQYYPRQLTNAQLQTLTAPTQTSTLSLDFVNQVYTVGS